MRSKTKIKWLPRGLVTGPYLTLCKSQKEFNRVCKHLKATPVDFLIKDSHASTHFFTNNGEGLAVVCVKPSDRPTADMVVLLVHEAVHVWQNFCEDIGEKRPSDEFAAYSIQGISSRLIKAFYANGIAPMEIKCKAKKPKPKASVV